MLLSAPAFNPMKSQKIPCRMGQRVLFITMKALVINRFSSEKCFTVKSLICWKSAAVSEASATVLKDLAHSIAVAFEEVIIEIFGASRWWPKEERTRSRQSKGTASG